MITQAAINYQITIQKLTKLRLDEKNATLALSKITGQITMMNAEVERAQSALLSTAIKLRGPENENTAQPTIQGNSSPETKTDETINTKAKGRTKPKKT